MKFLVIMTWKQPMNEEIMALLPAEGERIQELVEQGVQEASYVAADMSTLWSVWNCPSVDDVQEILRNLPVYPYSDFEVIELGEEG